MSRSPSLRPRIGCSSGVRISAARVGFGVTVTRTTSWPSPVFSTVVSTPGGIRTASISCSSSLWAPVRIRAAPSITTNSMSDESKPRRVSVCPPSRQSRSHTSRGRSNRVTCIGRSRRNRRERLRLTTSIRGYLPAADEAFASANVARIFSIRWLPEARSATRRAFLNATASERPWAINTTPLMPSRLAPPYSS
jgi:hypothetical protein